MTLPQGLKTVKTENIKLGNIFYRISKTVQDISSLTRLGIHPHQECFHVLIALSDIILSP